MGLAERKPGIRPTSARNAADVSTQLDVFEGILGQTAGSAPGVDRENFSQLAGIQESKIDFDSSSGHDHDPLTSGKGAEIALKSVGDEQIDWHDATAPPTYVRGTQTGTIVRFGFWNDQKENGTTTIFKYNGGTSGSPISYQAPSLDTYRVYFSTGHFITSGNNASEGGEPFPVGSSPVVSFTFVATMDVTAGPTLEDFLLSLDSANNHDTAVRVSGAAPLLSASITTVTHEFFDFVPFFVSNVDDPQGLGFVGDVYGIYWVAYYDPTLDAVVS